MKPIPSPRRRRVWAFSDLHVDHADNLAQVRSISATEHRDDALIVAGDVTDDMQRLRSTLADLRQKFATVSFVPGNHELWVRRRDHADSIERFEAILALCREIDVATGPLRFGDVWIVPLLSWYTKPEEGPDSLFIEKLGEDPSLRMWADEFCVRWPELPDGQHPAAWFAARNEERLARRYDGPVLSFSHFLPRADLMFRSSDERARGVAAIGDRHPSFNFSRVAGSSLIERQIRALGSVVHVYGHQHRNRDRRIDGVRYVSHCMGYPGEYGPAAGTTHNHPVQIWESLDPAGAGPPTFRPAR